MMYNKWEYFRVKKKFTFLPLRIYQYTSQTTWWSWFKTTYILQEKCYPSESSGINAISSYFIGHFWRNSRISDDTEYQNYVNRII